MHFAPLTLHGKLNFKWYSICYYSVYIQDNKTIICLTVLTTLHIYQAQSSHRCSERSTKKTLITKEGPIFPEFASRVPLVAAWFYTGMHVRQWLPYLLSSRTAPSLLDNHDNSFRCVRDDYSKLFNFRRYLPRFKIRMSVQGFVSNQSYTQLFILVFEKFEDSYNPRLCHFSPSSCRQ